MPELSMMNDIDNKLGGIDTLTIGKNMLEMAMFDSWVNCLDFASGQKPKRQVVEKSWLLFLCLYLFDNIIFSMLLPMFFVRKKDGTEQQKKRRIPGRNTLALHPPGSVFWALKINLCFPNLYILINEN